MNPIEIYKEATKLPNNNEPHQKSEEEVLREKQLIEQARQNNLAAWQQWRALPQTVFFLSVLNTYMSQRALQTAVMASNVPQMLEIDIRAKLAEVSILHKILTETIVDGKLNIN
jgi:hypothetical protein